VVRYSKEEPYTANRENIRDCDIVFIAVPTPTTPEGFDASIVRAVLELVGHGKTAVIKSTLQPGTTEKLALEFPHLFVLHSPEFLREKSAAYDAAHPERNIIGIPVESDEYRTRAQEVMRVLPHAPFSIVIGARAAELVKYIGNCFLFTKVVFLNVMYDLAEKLDVEWEDVREALVADPRIGESHTRIFHESGHGGEPGRGAGGHCLPKDFAAIRGLYEHLAPSDIEGLAMLRALESVNIKLLRSSSKDEDLLDGIYGAANELTSA
jgi:UDPglucose 6-dehydrogenase